MRHAVYVSAGTVFWTVVLVCYFNTKYVQAAPSEDVPIGSKSEDPSSQVSFDFYFLFVFLFLFLFSLLY